MKVLKKWFTYMIGALISLILLISAAFMTMTAPKNARAAESGYATFSSTETYVQKDLLASLPKTYVATVTMGTDAGRSTIYSNYKNPALGAVVNFEINAAGNPRLYVYNGTGGVYNTDFVFDKINVHTGEKTKIAITFDGTTASCYINGVKDENAPTVTTNGIASLTFSNALMKERMVIGGLPDTPANYFKSENSTMHLIRAYADVRTDAEIVSDHITYGDGVDYNDSNLMFVYKFDGYKDALEIPDLSKNKNDLVRTVYPEFDASNTYVQQQVPASLPKTYEATVTMGTTSGRAFLYSNYTNPANGAVATFEINANGYPRLYVYNTAAGVTFNKDFVFSGIGDNLKTGKKTRVAITFNGTTAVCYINGTAKQTITVDATLDFANATMKQKMVIGSLPGGSANFFDSSKSTLHSVAAYADLRSAAEIAADCADYDYSDSDLLFAYDFVGYKDAVRIPDLSTKHNDIARTGFTWSDTSGINPGDYAFSFMVVGDTQIVSRQSMREQTDYVSTIYKYVADTAQEKNTKFVFQLGDITEYNAYNEWDLARKAIRQLDGVVPYSLIRGNHDFPANTWWDTKLKENESAYLTNFGAVEQNGYGYERVFGVNSTYAEQGGIILYEDENGNKSTLNTAQFFTGADNLRYLAIALDFGPTDHMLAWAENLIAANPNHNVIITTHGYLDDDNQLIYDNKTGASDMHAGPYGSSSNEGTDMWNELISQYSNIQLVMCGHELHDQIIYRQDAGVNGGVVTQMMINPQDTDIKNMGQPALKADGVTQNLLTGMVATFYVSKDGKTVDVEYYSPIQQKYFLYENQFTFEMDAIEYPVYEINVSNDTTKGSIVNSNFDPARMYEAGQQITFSVSPTSGYQVSMVRYNGNVLTADSSGVYTATIAAQVNTLQIDYETLLYQVEVPDGVTVSGAQDSYIYGSTVSATARLQPDDALPDVSYRISAIKINGQPVAFDAESGAFSFTVLKDTTIEIEYKVTYTIKTTATGSGTVTILNTGYTSGNEKRYDADSTINVEVMADKGNRLVSVTINGEQASVFGGKITFTLTEDTQIDAVFEEYQSLDAEEMFTMQMYGSSIRLYTSSATRYSGIQFRAVMREDQYNTMREYYFGKNTPRVDQVDENTTTETSYFMGLKVIPRYALGSGELLYNTANTLGGSWQNAKWTAFEDNPDITEDDIYAQGSYLQGVYRLYDLPEWAYIYDVVARSYIQEQIVTIVVNDDGTTSKTTTTNVYYTDTLEISMAQVATNYVQKYEDSNNSVYANPVLLNAANDYRPDHYLIYSDGEEQVRELAQWGDTVTRDENLSEITYSKTVFTLPAQKGYTKGSTAQTFRGILSGGKYLMTVSNSVSSAFTPLTIKDDVNVFCLYTQNSKLIQKFDLETSRDAAIKFQDIPLDREIYSIVFKDSSGNTVFSADTTENSALVYGGSVVGWNGEVFDATGMSLADFYNSATATLTLPKQIAQSMVDEFGDYGDDKFSVEILAGSTDVNNPDYVMYETTGALCSMKIATETDLYNWGKVAKTDYLNMMKNYQTIDDGKYAYSIDDTDLDANKVFMQGKTKGVEQGEHKDLTTQVHNEFRWGGYFVLANDIECTEGNVYESFIDVTTLSWSYKNGTSLLPANGQNLDGSAINNWASGRMYGFHGTFDGRGYNINNISIVTHNYNEKDGTVKSAYAGGFIGLLGKEAVIKHVSFTNAEQNFAGGFVNSAGCGSIEGVYVHIDKIDKTEVQTSNGSMSGVFFATDSMWEANMENCFVNVTEDLTGITNYYAIGYIHADFGQLQQVFVVGGNYDDNYAIRESTTPNDNTYADIDPDVKGVDYDTYQTYDDMRLANIDFSAWTVDGFWAVRNGLPYPKRLDVDMQSVRLADSRFVEGALVSNYYPSMRIPYYEIDSRFGYLDINQEAKDAGCTVTYSTDNVLIIDIIEGMAIDKLDILVRSAYSGEVSFKREIKIVQAVTEFIEEYNSFDSATGTYVGAGVNGGSKANPAIDVSQYESVYGGLSAFNYFGTTDYSGFATTYDANAKTLTYPQDKFTMTAYGESAKQVATFVANDTGTATASKIYALGAAPVVLVTQELNNAWELQHWLGVAKALHANNADISDHYWGGYFVLGNDIDFLDETVPCTNSACPDFGTASCTDARHRSVYGQYAIKFDSTKNEACSHYSSDPGGWIANWHDIANLGFGGTFDGYGHTIDRYDSYGINAGGFIGVLHGNGVIKNVNFTNVVFGGISGFLTHTLGGTVENVYIEFKRIINGGVADPAGIFFSADKLTHYENGAPASAESLYEFGGLAYWSNGTTTYAGTIRNCFARFTGTDGLNITSLDYTVGNTTVNGVYTMSVIGGNAMAGTTIDNVFMVGGVTGYYKTLYRNASGATEATTTAFNDFGYFETKDAWMNAGGVNAYSGMGNYWTVKDGMPYPKTMYKGDSSETNADDIF